MKKIYILHDNNAWMIPIRKSFNLKNVPMEEWHINNISSLDLSKKPPEGIFLNRMSPSANSRGYKNSIEYTLSIISWLDTNNRKVINGYDSWKLEISKLDQYHALRKVGIKTPKTIAVVNKCDLNNAAKIVGFPFIIKYNCGGSGLGVKLINDKSDLRKVGNDYFSKAIGGIVLAQEFIRSKEPFIYRYEFIGGQLIYTVKINTNNGFELCPADSCSLDGKYCPTNLLADDDRFNIIPLYEDNDIVKKYKKFLGTNNIEIGGIEMIYDEIDNAYTYDINANTNYNVRAESIARISANNYLVDYLSRLLKKI